MLSLVVMPYQYNVIFLNNNISTFHTNIHKLVVAISQNNILVDDLFAVNTRAAAADHIIKITWDYIRQSKSGATERC